MSREGIAVFVEKLHDAFRADDPFVGDKQHEAGNVARLQALYGAVARDDWAAFGEGLADDIEMEIVGPETIPFVGRCRGRARVTETVRNNFAGLTDQWPEVVSLLAQGDCIVVVFHEEGHLLDTGKSYRVFATQIFTFREGKVVRFVEMFDSAPILAALQPN